MAIQAFGPDGKEVERGVEGELVCTKPFPCQPLGFWPLDGMGAPQELVNEASARHRAAYFGVWPGIWCEYLHCLCGDWARLPCIGSFFAALSPVPWLERPPRYSRD